MLISTEALIIFILNLQELMRESLVHFLQLNSVEVAVQLTLEDFSILRQIEPTEYIDDLFQLKSRYGTPMLTQFAEVCFFHVSFIILNNNNSNVSK